MSKGKLSDITAHIFLVGLSVYNLLCAIIVSNISGSLSSFLSRNSVNKKDRAKKRANIEFHYI